ncbi:uncharacterized protein LOC135403171 [Pseudopipra pipra]|uniref:uncharacterized protein LOC135403171 n=1 Tax=Pseudopipra pipra TaxID=415032 RepID=UPI00313990A9
MMAVKGTHGLSILISPIPTRSPASQPGPAASAVQSPDRRRAAAALACPRHPARPRREPERRRRRAQPRGGAGGGGQGRERKAEEGEEAERRRPVRSREPGLAGAARRGRRSGGMRRWRGAGLAALAAVLLVAAGRAQVQQEPLAQTPEGTEITINCSHPTIRTGYYIHWYRQLRGRGPQLLALIVQGSKELPDKAGQVSVSPDRRWSTLCLSGPRVGDAAVYYCAVGDTARGAGAAAGHEPPRAGPGGAGGTAPAGASRGHAANPT